MSFDPAYLELMPDEIEIAQPVVDGPTDVYGATILEDEPAGGWPRARCRIEPGSEMRVNESGRKVVDGGRLFVAGVFDIRPGKTVVIMPDGSRPVIRESAIVRDEEGAHHTVVVLA